MRPAKIHQHGVTALRCPVFALVSTRPAPGHHEHDLMALSRVALAGIFRPTALMPHNPHVPIKGARAFAGKTGGTVQKHRFLLSKIIQAYSKSLQVTP